MKFLLLILLTISTFLVAPLSHAQSVSEFNFDSVPGVGSFAVEKINGMNPGETADLICVSEDGKIETYEENVGVNAKGELNQPLEINPIFCSHNYYAFRFNKGASKRISVPFIHFLAPPVEREATEIPNIWSIDTVPLNDEGETQIIITSSTIESYFVSSDVTDVQEWKEYEGKPFNIHLKNLGEKNTVYLTFSNGSLMKTMILTFDPEMAATIEEDLVEFLSEKEARVYAQLLAGKNLTKEDFSLILSNPESIRAYLDPDNDGLTSDQEERYGTNPELSDTDGDGVNDGKEVLVLGTNPLLAEEDTSLRFANLQEGSSIQSSTSTITGSGLANTETSISFVDTETGNQISQLEIISNADGVFTFSVPAEVQNHNFEIIAKQSGSETRIANISAQDVQDALNFTVDAINEVEIPLKSGIVSETSVKVRKGDSLTLYGTLTNTLIPKGVSIVATIQKSDSNESQAASFVVRRNSLGLFAINLPNIEIGEYSITVQSSDSSSLGPSLTVPLTVTYAESQNLIITASKKLNPYILAFIAFVGTLSIYTFYFSRKRQKTSISEEVSEKTEEEISPPVI